MPMFTLEQSIKALDPADALGPESEVIKNALNPAWAQSNNAVRDLCKTKDQKAAQI